MFERHWQSFVLAADTGGASHLNLKLMKTSALQLQLHLMPALRYWHPPRRSWRSFFFQAGSHLQQLLRLPARQLLPQVGLRQAVGIPVVTRVESPGMSRMTPRLWLCHFRRSY